ncbi:oligosaccharide flippase family protein [Roseovarius phycicola]|uniref:Oligosaccharide flippase family protein n=1 Tax=Roseovarius phycicola TaxID=3080976 RepID=A0ABZ2HJC7_9RHOB
MSTQFWSFGLQWSRVGINAALFLIATRFLSLTEIGLFATAFAPIRLSQGLHRAGIAETVIILGKHPWRLNGLFVVSTALGLFLAVVFASIGYLTATPTLIALAIIPLLNGLGAVSEGLLRRNLRLRALALRTAIIQSVAALSALGLLAAGFGIWALIGFAVLNAFGTCLLNCMLARWVPTRLPRFADVTPLLPKVAQIAARDIVGAAQMPLALLAVGLTLGLPAAGAFQIATRIYNLIDALTLSPLRFIALPQLAQDTVGSRLRFVEHLSRAAWLASWVWAIVLLFAPDLLGLLLTHEHASATAPILRAFAGLGLFSALTMPLNQALTVRLQTSLVLQRAIVMLCLGALLLLPALTVSPTACALALSAAAFIVNLWYIPTALPRLYLNFKDLSVAGSPLLAAGLAICLILITPNLPMIAQLACGTLIYLCLVALLPKPNMRPT